MLDAYIVMIPKEGGDATPIGQISLCSLLCTDCGLQSGCVMSRNGSNPGSHSVISAGSGRGSVDAWCTTAMDKEECQEVRKMTMSTFFADVVKSFDTVDTNIPDCIKYAWTAWLVSPRSVQISCLMIQTCG